MQAKPCEFELRVGWIDKGRYFVSARFVHPEKDLEDHLLDPVEIDLDLDELAANAADPAAYGERLTGMLFGAEQRIRDAYGTARARTSGNPLKLRIAIQGTAPELQSIHWELLNDPADARPLAQHEQVWFSRFLSSNDYRSLAERDGGPLQALIVIADPSDGLSKWRLPRIDREQEIHRALSALERDRFASRRITPYVLEGRATVLNIVSALKEKDCDILYLLCHGALVEGHEPRLLLEAEDGTGRSIAGQEIVERLSDMSQYPRLVLLASCESAGSETGGATNAIGSRLAAAGVPSVVAMQGKISIATADRFTAALLKELVETGQIDRSMAAARAAVRDQPDWWMPVLFSRSRTGRLWSDLRTEPRAFNRWEGILTDVKECQFVPILGPGLVESVFGSTRNMAKGWAERYEFPLAPRDRDDLAQVAQYLVYRQSRKFALSELRTHLLRQARELYRGERTSPASASDMSDGMLNDLISRIGKRQRDSDPQDVHRLLARLPARVYVNANRDNLLRDALADAGRAPQVQLCIWRSGNDPAKVLQVFGPKPPRSYVPSVQSPLIFHVFGNLERTGSLVLTEDDYFDFLTAVTTNEGGNRKLAIPGAVTSAFAVSGWMLLGFQTDDWDFRVLLRGILKQPGDQSDPRDDEGVRVAVQVNPIEGHLIDPDRAGDYIANFFSRQARIDTFWGSPRDFLATLVAKCAAEGLLYPEFQGPREESNAG